MLRITDLESGMVVDIDVRDIAVDGFREQLDRGAKKPKNRRAFLKRLEHRIELAIEESLDLSLQPPRSHEQTEAVYRALSQKISIPHEAFRRRTAMLKFLQDNPRNLPTDESQILSDEEQS